MSLNHLNLTVPDVQQTRDFFEKYFGFRLLSDQGNLVVLSDESGFVLTLNSFGGAADVPLSGLIGCLGCAVRYGQLGANEDRDGIGKAKIATTLMNSNTKIVGTYISLEYCSYPIRIVRLWERGG